MAKKRLLDKEENYTKEALKFQNELNDAIKPIVKKRFDKGYPATDIHYVLYGSYAIEFLCAQVDRLIDKKVIKIRG